MVSSTNNNANTFLVRAVQCIAETSGNPVFHGKQEKKYRVTQDTGHLEILAKFQVLYKHDLDTWRFSKCMIS